MSQFSYSDFEIYDAHAHIFPEKISEKAAAAIGVFYDIPMYTSGSSARLLDEEAKINTRRCLVCSTATVVDQVVPINTFIRSECDAHPEFFGFGTLHPDMTQDEAGAEVDRIISLGLHGVKFHHDFQKFDIDSPEAYKLYEIVGGRLPVLFHMGDNRYEYSKPKRLARAMKDFPQLQVMAAHFGGYKSWDEAEDNLTPSERLHFDTSSSLPFISAEHARRLISHYGVESFFFGSDFPMWSPEKELERFFGIGLSYEDNKKILADNFRQYFNL